LNPVKEWEHVNRFTGRWTERLSGGCSNFPSWNNNPSFTLRSHAPPGVLHQVTFMLTTDYAEQDFARAPSVGMYILQDGNVIGHSASFAQHVCHVAQFNGNGIPFTVLLSTFNPNVQVGFVLTASSDYPFEMVPNEEGFLNY